MNKAAHKMREIGSVLTKLAARYERRHNGEQPPGACQHEAIEQRTPASELEEKEEREGIREPGQEPLFAGMVERKTPFDEMEEQEERWRAESEDAMRVAMEALSWFIGFLFAEGPHPAKTMRRLYAWAKKYRPELIWDAGYRDIGKLLDESHGSMEWRIGVLIDDYGNALGVTGVKAGWQRDEEACSAYSAAQKNNSNRVGGKKSARGKVKKVNSEQ